MIAIEPFPPSCFRNNIGGAYTTSAWTDYDRTFDCGTGCTCFVNYSGTEDVDLPPMAFDAPRPMFAGRATKPKVSREDRRRARKRQRMARKRARQ